MTSRLLVALIKIGERYEKVKVDRCMDVVMYVQYQTSLLMLRARKYASLGGFQLPPQDCLLSRSACRGLQSGGAIPDTCGRARCRGA